ncbi:MAG: beta-CASP ribonuclease aCPSF1 [Candidatus Caldarchaeum sp.]|nr:beta-CASP ribonuclease aCPSF1 [Candidatus Caldarchaeum sp.]MDW8435049.1 beta-CASP ribonuclease aCPSF1 [Candidatus Caldarchaeum sp.]
MLASVERLRTELLRYFVSLETAEPAVSRIEYEGPRIAVYTKNRDVFRDRDKIARELVTLIKKRVVIRPDEELRRPKDETEEIIKRTLGDGYRLIFDEPLGEIVIESSDPRITNIDRTEILNHLIEETGWVIRINRDPLMPSKTIDRIKRYSYWNTKEKLEILRNVGERTFRTMTFDSRDVRITVLGAGRQVGRSCLLIQTSESNVLLDCGLSAGASSSLSFYPRFDVVPDLIQNLDAIVISHAHLDHVGLVPYLFKYGYRGPVYAVEPSIPLMALEVTDYVSVAGKEGSFAPYGEADIRLALQHSFPLKYGVVTNITPDIRVMFYNAGHILGSAAVHVHVGEGLHNIVYTGDFKYERSTALDPCVSKFPRVETLIMESTYGATPVPYTLEQSEAILAEKITSTINRGGKVIIPVPAIGRAQEIMLVLNKLLAEKKLAETPVFLDGLVVEATAIHTAFPDYFTAELQQKLREGENIFLSEYFTPVKSEQQRQEILETKGPTVVISTSGMLEGGPVLRYLKEFAADENNLLLFVSYQVEGTLGRTLLKGVREITLRNEEGKAEIVNVKMQVEKVDGFSGHSSRQQLINYVRRINPKPRNIVLVHGEEQAVDSLAEALSRITPATIFTPHNLETISPVS